MHVRNISTAFSNSALRSSSLGSIAIIGGVFLLAVLFGLVATTASPVLVAIAAGLVVGPMLLFKPNWMVTALIFGGLFVVGLIQIFLPGLDRVSYLLSMLGVALALRTYLGIMSREFSKQYVPAFVWLGAAIPLIFLLQSLLMSPSPMETVAGMKRLFHMWGLFLAVALLPFSVRDFALWRKLLIALAFLQLPFVLHQLVFLVPLRAGRALQGIVPHDIIAGTFGAFMDSGGASAEMCVFLVIALAAVVASWREDLLSGKTALLLALLFAAPLFLGENKIVIVFLPVTFLVLYRVEALKNPVVFVCGATVLAGLLGFALYVYLTYFSTSKDLQGMFESTVAYNFGKVGYGALGLNRTTVLSFWWAEHGLGNPQYWLLGHGLGSSSIAQGGLVTGHLGSKYGMLGISLTSLSTLLWDVGLFGTFLMVLMLYMAGKEMLRVARVANPTVRVMANALLVAIVLFTICLPYRNSFHAVFSFSVLFALLVGTCGHLACLYATESGKVHGLVNGVADGSFPRSINAGSRG